MQHRRRSGTRRPGRRLAPPGAGNRTSRARSLLRLSFLLLVLAGLAAPAAEAGTAPSGGGAVLATHVDTSITPVVADHLADGIQRAEDGGYAAYVLLVDSPGGLVTSMRDIVEDVLAADVPVIAYVSPDGAQAASAAAVITLSAHVAYMAPGTNIGAATPISGGGEDLDAKATNDMAAFVDSLARLRDRDPAFWEDTVREGRSASVDEAVELGAVDGRAASMAAVLDGTHGTVVELRSGASVTLETAAAAVDRYDMGAFRSILQFLADPNVSVLLISIGTLGLIYELASPGIGVGGTVGAVALILGLYGVAVLPVNAVGVVLLLIAVALFVAELFAPGIGGFAFGGAVVLVLSGLFLFDDSSGVEVSLGALLPTALVLGVAVTFAGRLALRARSAPSVSTGADVLLGHELTVREVEDDRVEGRAFTEGGWWSVRSTGEPLSPGQHARVVRLDGLTLVVQPEARTTDLADPAADSGSADETERRGNA